MSAVIAICVTWVQSAVLSSERDSYSYEAKLSVATLEADNDTLHPCQCLHTRFSYDCFAQHTIGLLTRLSVFYSAKCEVMLGLTSNWYWLFHRNRNN